jgi:hypothetical protein
LAALLALLLAALLALLAMHRPADLASSIASQAIGNCPA